MPGSATIAQRLAAGRWRRRPGGKRERQQQLARLRPLPAQVGDPHRRARRSCFRPAASRPARSRRTAQRGIFGVAHVVLRLRSSPRPHIGPVGWMSWRAARGAGSHRSPARARTRSGCRRASRPRLRRRWPSRRRAMRAASTALNNSERAADSRMERWSRCTRWPANMRQRRLDVVARRGRSAARRNSWAGRARRSAASRASIAAAIALHVAQHQHEAVARQRAARQLAVVPGGVRARAGRRTPASRVSGAMRLGRCTREALARHRVAVLHAGIADAHLRDAGPARRCAWRRRRCSCRAFPPSAAGARPARSARSRRFPRPGNPPAPARIARLTARPHRGRAARVAHARTSSTTACAARPSPRPVKPRRFGGGGLDADVVRPPHPGRRRAAGAHRRRVRRHLRALADHGDVGIAQAPAAFGHQRRAVAQEQAAVGVLPARVGAAGNARRCRPAPARPAARRTARGSPRRRRNAPARRGRGRCARRPASRGRRRRRRARRSPGRCAHVENCH